MLAFHKNKKIKRWCYHALQRTAKLDQIAEKNKQSTVHVATTSTRGKTLNLPKTTKLSSTTPSFSLIASSLAPNHWCYTLTWRHSLDSRAMINDNVPIQVLVFHCYFPQIGGSHCMAQITRPTGKLYRWRGLDVLLTTKPSLTRSWLGPVYIISRFSRLD